MSANEIVFYDIASRFGPVATNPNTWKTRLSLNYKGLSYKAIFINFKNIQANARAVGAPPTSRWPDGSDRYTNPVIRLPDGTVVSESFRIAKKLDEVYPEKPLISDGLADIAAEEIDFFRANIVKPSTSLGIDGLVDVLLDPADGQYLRNDGIGKGIPSAPAPGTPERKAMWENIQAGWHALGLFLDERAQSTSKQTPLFVDFVIVAHLLGFKNVVSGQEWAENYQRWDGGRWVELMEKYDELTKRND